jgi:hypothetical protein
MKKLFKQQLEQSASGDTRVYTQRYTPPGLDGDRGDYVGNMDQFRDFPDVEDPSPYTTYRSLEQKLEEALKDDAPEEPASTEAPPEGDEAMQQQDPNMMQQDPNAMGGMPGQDPNDPNAMGMGMPGMEVPLNQQELGRVFELKKIYARLSSIETYLVRTTDKEMLDLRKLVSQAVDLFEVVISNYNQYKDKIDEIIVIFYQLLDQVYTAVRKYFIDNENNF